MLDWWNVKPCIHCGGQDRYKNGKGDCKACTKARLTAKRHALNPDAKYVIRTTDGSCGICGDYNRFPSGGCKTCAQARYGTPAHENSKKASRSKHWDSKLLQSARNISRLHGLAFNLEIQDIRIPEFCPLLGLRLDSAAPPRAPNLPSLDRIDSSKGYVRGNVHVISWRANVLKRDATIDEIRLLAAGMNRVYSKIRIPGGVSRDFEHSMHKWRNPHCEPARKTGKACVDGVIGCSVKHCYQCDWPSAEVCVECGRRLCARCTEEGCKCLLPEVDPDTYCYEELTE